MKGSRRMNLPANAVVEELLHLLEIGDELTRFHFLWWQRGCTALMYHL
jgi:hypothetical protein